MGEETLEEAQNRYMEALHGVQSGVAAKMNFSPNETTAKHLRVGVNSAMIQNAALVTLLMKKGVFTEQEWYTTLADIAERERGLYEEEIRAYYQNNNINLR